MKHQRPFAFAFAALTAVTLACSKTPSTPTAPGGSSAEDLGAAADGSTLKVTAPIPVEPIGGVEITDLDPDLVIENSTPLYVSSLNVSYIFEVIDEDGQLVYTSPQIPQGAGGRTTHEIGKDLDMNEVHTWGARAVYQGRQGPRSANASFKTFSRFGVSCARPGATPLDIVACRFEQHDGGSGMDHEELIQFMREVAYDLNQLGISDKGGFGLAVKTVGNNCLGYSCDIICEGHGNDQNQYDILRDESEPQWSEVSEVSVRECEIVK
jgi:hypothetical protein